MNIACGIHQIVNCSFIFLYQISRIFWVLEYHGSLL